MIYFLGVISVLLLFLISAIHVYWAFGGKWGISGVIPTKNIDQKVMSPPFIATLIVAIVIAGFAIIYAKKLALFSSITFPNWVNIYGIYIVAGVFIARAIGDFTYVGFFKRIKNTKFAKNDTLYFSPLCLFLGVVGFIIAYF